MKKKQIPMNKLVYLGLSILEMSKTVINEFCYDYVKPTYGEKKVKLSYIDTGTFTVYVKIEDIYVDIEEDVEARFDTSSYELDRQLPKGKK